MDIFYCPMCQQSTPHTSTKFKYKTNAEGCFSYSVDLEQKESHKWHRHVIRAIESQFAPNISNNWTTNLCTKCGQSNLKHNKINAMNVPPAKELSPNLQALYYEAQSIAIISPRGALGLLRCILENLLIYKFDVKNKTKLFEILTEQKVKKALGENIINITNDFKNICNIALHEPTYDKDGVISQLPKLFQWINALAALLDLNQNFNFDVEIVKYNQKKSDKFSPTKNGLSNDNTNILDNDEIHSNMLKVSKEWSKSKQIKPLTSANKTKNSRKPKKFNKRANPHKNESKSSNNIID